MENTEKSSAPAPSSSGAGGKEKIEKQARQLAYDTRYKVKQAMAAKSGSKLDPAAVRKAYAAQLGKSPASPPVKARAKEMLLGEDLVDINKLAADSIASAMYKVFVEHHEKDADGNVIPHEVEEEIKEDSGEKTYKVRVTDKKTGNTYIRNATRDKIRELRANPNISSVEMTEYGEATKSEKHSGKNTAAVKSGKGDEVSGKDPRIDLKKNEDYSWKNGFAELIEKKKSEDKKTVTGEGVDNKKLIKVFPNEVGESKDYGSQTARQGDNEAAAAARKRIYNRATPADQDYMDAREISHQRNLERSKKIVTKEDTENVTEVVGLVKKAVKLPGQIAQIPGKVTGAVVGNIPVVGGVAKSAVQLPGKIASAPGKAVAGIIPGGKKKANEQYSNWREETEDVNEVVGSIIGGALGRNVLPGLIAKTGAKAAIGKVAGEKVASALTGKVAGTAIGAAAGEMIDPLKKKKSPVGAAAGGAVAGLVASSNELEGETIEEADSLSKQVSRWEANRQRRMKASGTYERPNWIPRDQDHSDSYGSSKGEKRKPQKTHANLQNEEELKEWPKWDPAGAKAKREALRQSGGGDHTIWKVKLGDAGLSKDVDITKDPGGAIQQVAKDKVVTPVVNNAKSSVASAGQALKSAALPVAAGLAAKAVVDKVTGKKEKVKEDSDYGDGQEAPAPGTVCFDDGAALPATIKPIGDPRELATTINLIKNKWRAKGLKMSYEPEGDKIDEGLGTALGGAVGGPAGAALTGAAVGTKDKSKKDKGRVKKAAGSGIGALVGQGLLPGPAGAALGGYVGGKLSNSHVPEGDMIEEGEVNRADIIGGTKAAKNAQKGIGKYTPGKGVTKNFQLDPNFVKDSFDSEKDMITSILESEKVAAGADKRAKELAQKRRNKGYKEQGYNAYRPGKNERAAYNLASSARSADSSPETQRTKKKKPAGADTSQIGHYAKRDAKETVGKRGKPLKKPRYKLSLGQRVDHHSNKAYNRRDPKQNPKHEANK